MTDFVSLMCIWADFKTNSTVVSFVYMQRFSEFDV